MSDSTPVKNGLIPAVAQMMRAWLVNAGCDFVKFVKWCLVNWGRFYVTGGGGGG